MNVSIIGKLISVDQFQKATRFVVREPDTFKEGKYIRNEVTLFVGNDSVSGKFLMKHKDKIDVICATAIMRQQYIPETKKNEYSIFVTGVDVISWKAASSRLEEAFKPVNDTNVVKSGDVIPETAKGMQDTTPEFIAAAFKELN